MERSKSVLWPTKDYHIRQLGLTTLRKSAENLGLDMNIYIEIERTDPVRAIVELKTAVGIGISSSESIQELRALSAFWQKIQELQIERRIAEKSPELEKTLLKEKFCLLQFKAKKVSKTALNRVEIF